MLKRGFKFAIKYLFSVLILLTVTLVMPAFAQNTVRMQCDVFLELSGDLNSITIYGMVQSNIPVTADYTIEITAIGKANIGATTQSGVLKLQSNEFSRTGVAQFNFDKSSFYEAELSVKERMTGTECTTKKVL